MALEKSTIRSSLAVTLALAAIIVLGPASASAQEGIVYQQSSTIQVPGSKGLTYDVACPSGTVALGGGFSGAIQFEASHPQAGAWHIAGTSEQEVGDQEAVGFASCATAEAFPSGSLEYPPYTEIRLKPYPGPTYKDVLEAPCGSGFVPIAGGFSMEGAGGDAPQNPVNVGIGSSVPLWFIEQNQTGNSWLISGENYEDAILFSFESHTIYAFATCVKASLAFGVFGLNANTERQEVEEPTTTTARCGSGQVISGGFTASNSDGTEVLNSGDLEEMYFNGAGNGFSVGYRSGFPHHHLLVALAICGDIVPASATLGQADFDAACQAAMPRQSGVHAVTGRLATDWRCADGEGSSTPIPGNQGDWTCAALGHQGTTATFLNRKDAGSWVCYGLPEGAQPASKVRGRATVEPSTSKGKKPAAASGRQAGKTRVVVSGRSRVRRPVGNLGDARVTVPIMLLEATASGDLLRGGKGGPVHPTLLKAKGRRGRDFVYVGGSDPRLTLRLRLSKNKKAYLFRLNARGGRLAKPRLCDSGPQATTRLSTRLTIEAGERHSTDIVARSFWKCSGTLETARPALRLP